MLFKSNSTKQAELRKQARTEARLQRNLIKLKIKAKSLTEESKIIRKEELRIKHMKYFDEITDVERRTTIDSLSFHRGWDVRNEARATHLARAFLKSKDYRSVEASCKDWNTFRSYIFPRVFTIVKKYGDSKTTEFELKKWFGIN